MSIKAQNGEPRNDFKNTFHTEMIFTFGKGSVMDGDMIIFSIDSIRKTVNENDKKRKSKNYEKTTEMLSS